MAVHEIAITVKTPLSLGSGQADVNIDADIVHDAYGLPYFPARRLKGILYESAVEVAEMAELSQKPILSRTIVEELFHHVDTADVQMIVSDFHLPDYDTMCRDWSQLQRQYGAYIRPDDVLETYTSLRYQTALDADTGTARDGSLRNVRVLRAGTVFVGTIEIVHETPAYTQALALSLQNMRSAGLKRNRGFGQIVCTMKNQAELVQAALQAE